jgi:hypothetical protein
VRHTSLLTLDGSHLLQEQNNLQVLAIEVAEVSPIHQARADNQLKELVPKVDRGRQFIVSAYDHLSVAFRHAGRGLDKGLMKSFYPDASKPGEILGTSFVTSTADLRCCRELA